MKRKIMFLPFACLCLNACASNPKYDILKRPDDWKLEFWLLDTVDMTTISKDRLDEHYPGVIFYLDRHYSTNVGWQLYSQYTGYYVRYNFFNLDDTWIVTEVTIGDNSLNVYGLSIGYSEERGKQFFKDTGFEECDEYRFDYKKDHVRLNTDSKYLQFTYVY